ncbi:Crp/Fnr family transcriptional regulator [Chryseobacterium sp. MIQD13]|uniref:Crp/Fnr family transcriptional regulator n=1 Tax=Chryseobacterium sp. MIQD13 TaxID=3422310 RepID=UPI003D2B88C1
MKALTGINKKLFSHLNIDEEDPAWEKFTKFEFSKKKIFSNNKVYFVEEGLVRKFYIKEIADMDQEISADFYFPGEVFVVGEDTKEKPSEVFFESINKGFAWEIGLDEVKDMFAVNPECRFVQNYFLSRKLNAAMKREMLLLKNTPQDLYKYLLKNKSHYIKHIPLKYLASYIGITPISLSRIRKRIN